MTTEQKHEIEIPGLPEGWRVKEIRLWDALYEITPGSHNYNPCINTARFKCELIVEKIKPRRVVLEETWRWHINSTEGYVLVPAVSLIDMIDIEETQPDWMCYKVVVEE